MKTIIAQPISREAFALYGEYYSMVEPSNYALCGDLYAFYPDRITAMSRSAIGFSPLIVKKPDRMVIQTVEYHSHTWEMILPINDDMVIHVAPPTGGTYLPELTKAFVVPKGTLVKIHPAVWHLAPMPVHEQRLCAMAMVAECTYLHDCTIVQLEETQQLEIVL